MIASGAEYAILVNGHTDSTGPDEANLIISRQRAEAVREVLLEVGLSPARVAVLASGEASPIASNDDVAGRARNRRVEIVIGR